VTTLALFVGVGRVVTFEASRLRIRDKPGVNVLVWLARRMEVHVRNPTPSVRRLLSSTGAAGNLIIE
jgi:hypothetical protein